jgi:hypothetical protein
MYAAIQITPNKVFMERSKRCLLFLPLLLGVGSLRAQTDHDAIMMNKYQWCNGVSYTNAKWARYWEGAYKRTNENIGTLTTQSLMYMTNYGISDRLNIMGGISYIRTNASKGTLHGLEGLQDAGLYIKWKAAGIKAGRGRISLLASGGISTPVSSYVIDFLPMSIGLGSTNLSVRGIADYHAGIFFATVSAAYTRRSNVKLDRTSYYTTEIHLTNEVKMPDAAAFDLGMGIRKKYLVAEAQLKRMVTLGGFDIRKNDMPFVSNKMNSTAAGMHVKYTLPFYAHVELTADAGYVLSGRNVGQATYFGAGGYYIFSFRKDKNNL